MSLNFKIQTPWLKGAGKIPAERPDMSLDYLKGRALQYVLQRYGLRETRYREFAFSVPRSVQFDVQTIYVNGKREKRIAAVTVDGTRYDIPHWDFVPQVVDESQDSLTLFANSLSSDQACRLYQMIDPIAADDPYSPDFRRRAINGTCRLTAVSSRAAPRRRFTGNCANGPIWPPNRRSHAMRNRYHFAFLSSYRGETDYQMTDLATGQSCRVSLRWELDDSFPFNPDGRRDHETSLGILRGNAAENSGELPPEAIAAFNAWAISSGRSYCAGTVAGRWSRSNGWSRIAA